MVTVLNLQGTVWLSYVIKTTGIKGNLTSCDNRENFLSEASRASFVARQEARNIPRTLDNALKHRHDNDALSVDGLFRELRAEKESVLSALNLKEEKMRHTLPWAKRASYWELWHHSWQQCLKSTVREYCALTPHIKQTPMAFNWSL